MFKNKEETKLLSDDEFEGVSTRKKTVIFIITLIVIFIAAILAFKFIFKNIDKDIDAKQPEVAESGMVVEKTADEAGDFKKTIDYNEVTEGGNKEKILPAMRNTIVGDNEFICEYSEIHLPELMERGDYADVRLSLADGRNYTVVSEKKITDFNKSGEKSLLYMALCEEEIIILESAITDLKLFAGSKLYLVIGKHNNKNKVTYPVNRQADELLHPKGRVNNLSGYNYEVKFDKVLEKERFAAKKAMYIKGQEWKEAASYWNEKE